MEKIMSMLCKHMDTGVDGQMFGGQMLFYLDEAAAVYALSQCERSSRLVTYRFGETVFRKPVKINQILTFYGHEPTFTNSSISFRITVTADDATCLEADATLVAVDGNGKKAAIRPRKKL
ncbi:MAG: hotdog domain-containing protein [Victivallaceae bacterium]|nr:hotdog domain-containing protein [Victivallaceae bacterium]